MTTPDLAIGNGNVAALINRVGQVVWAPRPRIDGDTVFCSLIDAPKPKSGSFSIGFDEEALCASPSAIH
jgi:hypothetical protein